MDEAQRYMDAAEQCMRYTRDEPRDTEGALVWATLAVAAATLGSGWTAADCRIAERLLRCLLKEADIYETAGGWGLNQYGPAGTDLTMEEKAFLDRLLASGTD